MIYNNVELFNAEQLIKAEGIPGMVLNRFSKSAVEGLDSGTDRRGPVTQAYGNEIEIQFISESDSVDVYLGAWESDGYVSVSLGDYDHSTHYLPEGELTCLHLEKAQRLYLYESQGVERFSKNVWRLVYLKRYTPVFSHIEGDGIRPPEPTEIPGKTMLAYGSSITFGAGTGPMSAQTHMQILARKLGLQVMNKSMPGSCFCEKSYGDYLSSVSADFYYYELGGNMRLRYTPEEFAERSEYMVAETRRRNPVAPIFLLSVYPWLKRLPLEDSEKASRVIGEYDRTLSSLAENDPDIHLVDSSGILDDTRLLSFDGLHPSAYGNMVMADRIYDKIKHVILDR